MVKKFLIIMKKTFFIKKGDSKSISIASASILAKTFRDKLICVTTQNNFQHTIGTGTKGMGLDNILPQ